VRKGPFKSIEDDEMTVFSNHRSTISILTGLDNVANEWEAINKIEMLQSIEQG
jgi:hypothetical protein